MKQVGFHAQKIEDVLQKLGTSLSGLSPAEAAQRLRQYGPNKLPEPKGLSILGLIWRQLNNALVYVLIAAAIISFATGHPGDALVILAVMLLNMSIGTIQEYRANKAVATLKSLLIPQAKVFRSDKLAIIPAEELVIGDVVMVEQGDRIPADGRIVTQHSIRVIESALTGESMPVDKQLFELPEETDLASRKNMLWMGTLCTGGSAKFVVTATGTNTYLGQIAADLESVDEGDSHFQQITDKLTKQMGVLALLGSLAVLIIGLFVRSFEFADIFLFSVANLVAAIPESLPAILTVVLAVGASRISKRKAIVRSLAATENLGAVTVIATDKTGTLTQNSMSVEEICLADGMRVVVTGRGWDSVGEIYLDAKHTTPAYQRALTKLITIGFVSNSSQIVKNENKIQIIGDPTEAALITLGNKYNLQSGLRDSVQYDLTFNTDLKYRASLVNIEGTQEVFAAGAAEVILERADKFLNVDKIETLTIERRKQIHDAISALSQKSLRVLALAYRPVASNVTGGEIEIEDSDVEHMVFAGLVGMRDPVRPEAVGAIAKAKQAGIRTIMLTGDHKDTAQAVAKELNLADSPGMVITETELLELNDEQFVKAVMTKSVFARLTPQMKMRIARTLQSQGEILAMTGDGVNDAPALKQADVGIAMGKIGTDTAREASEIVLVDDNFASIVGAIEEGRVVFNNIKRASTFLITTNLAEQVVIIASLLFGLPLPLLAAQILWLNLVTDGLNDFALALEKGHGQAMARQPRDPKEGIITRDIAMFMIPTTLVMVVLTLGGFSLFLKHGEETARSVAFLAMSFTQLFNALNLKSFTSSLFKVGLFSNIYLTLALLISGFLTIAAVTWQPLVNLLRFTYIRAEVIILIIILSSAVLWVGEIIKLVRQK